MGIRSAYSHAHFLPWTGKAETTDKELKDQMARFLVWETRDWVERQPLVRRNCSTTRQTSRATLRTRSSTDGSGCMMTSLSTQRGPRRRARTSSTATRSQTSFSEDLRGAAGTLRLPEQAQEGAPSVRGGYVGVVQTSARR